MKLINLNTMEPSRLKAILKERNISFRDISISMDISQPVVSDVINQKYKGAEEMKSRVYAQISKMLEGREDLSDDIYTNINTVDKLLQVGINSAKFTIPEKEFLIALHKKLNAYKLNQLNHA